MLEIVTRQYSTLSRQNTLTQPPVDDGVLVSQVEWGDPPTCGSLENEISKNVLSIIRDWLTSTDEPSETGKASKIVPKQASN